MPVVEVLWFPSPVDYIADIGLNIWGKWKNLDPAHLASVHAYLSKIVAICRHLYSIWWVRIVDIWRSAEYQQEQLANSLLLKWIWL